MVDFNQMKAFVEDPLILTRGAGTRVADVSGQSYLDAASGVFTTSLGYSAEPIVEAMHAQLRRLAFASPVSSVSDRALELIDQLIELTQRRYLQVKLFTTGSEAIEAAIRFSRQYHKQTGQAGRFKVISLYHGFHGATLGSLSATGWPRMRSPYEPLAGGFVHVRPPICGRPLVAHDHERCGEGYAAELRDVIVNEGPDTVAAVLLEPVMTSAGVHVLPTAYLEAVRQACNDFGVLLIYDEIITGFGRTGAWFAADHSGVWPDMLCVGKGISAGYAPLSALLMTQTIGDAFWGDPDEYVQFQSGHTYAGNPVSAAAGLAVIDFIKSQGVLENVARSGRHLASRMSALAETTGMILETRGIGLLCGVELSAKASKPPLGSMARKRGLLVRPWQSADGLTVAPPLVSTTSDIDEIADILGSCFEELTAKPSP